ncbi:acetyltransferase [Methylocystis sp. WRRC1]|uniref:acetyltransferase n=1 Tax=Methylocystis sp. WRRC1 TaxID=1732014 RepID=UPI001D15C77C|nr:acetyltransferase [Methylocystis sp. WRRC1]MCC3245036.1 acetyltransferase [Methylocystis sp. WRRC1]
MNDAGKRRLVIVGDSAFAEIAYEYFKYDSVYEPVAFAVEKAFLRRERLLDLPVVALEQLTDLYAPAAHHVFVAITYGQLNRLRRRLLDEVKSRGYSAASYISSKAFVWRNVELGEHCFIMEDNVVQPFVKVGSNVIMWSGNHIGHHSTIGENVFLSSHVVVSGFCKIGRNTFLGVNTTLANNVTVGDDNWTGPGVTLMNDTEPAALYPAKSEEPSKVSALRFFKVRVGT